MIANHSAAVSAAARRCACCFFIFLRNNSNMRSTKAISLTIKYHKDSHGIFAKYINIRFLNKAINSYTCILQSTNSRLDTNITCTSCMYKY